MDDLISLFMEYTDGTVSSPAIYRLWSGIALVAGALERRVWSKTIYGVNFPNQFIFLMGKPAVGKNVIVKVENLWRRVRELSRPNEEYLKLCPKSVNFASIVREFVKARKIYLPKSGQPYQYHSLIAAAPEFGIFFPEYDTKILEKLNDIWGNPEFYSESRKTGPENERDVKITNPNFTLLAGLQPAVMASRFGQEAWDSGFMRRVIFIFADEGIRLDLLGEIRDTTKLENKIIARLNSLGQQYGQFDWGRGALESLALWDRTGREPVPNHPRLNNYNESRLELVSRLCLVSAASAGETMIRVDDVERSIFWLTSAEVDMPGVFASMGGKGDDKILEDLWFFVRSSWQTDKRAVLVSEAVRFLLRRAPQDKIRGMLDAAVAGDYLKWSSPGKERLMWMDKSLWKKEEVNY